MKMAVYANWPISANINRPVAASFQLARNAHGKLKTCRHKAMANINRPVECAWQVENLPPQGNGQYQPARGMRLAS